MTAEGLSVRIAEYRSPTSSHVTHFPVLSVLAVGDYEEDGWRSSLPLPPSMEVKHPPPLPLSPLGFSLGLKGLPRWWWQGVDTPAHVLGLGSTPLAVGGEHYRGTLWALFWVELVGVGIWDRPS